MNFVTDEGKMLSKILFLPSVSTREREIKRERERERERDP